MKAVQILGDATSPKIVVNDSIPKPEPRNAELLVQVYAAGITGDEVIWPEVYETPSRIPGHDISGIITAVGPSYDGPLKIGQAVFALLNTNRGEGQAEYAICSAEEVALKPASITHAEAAALPIPALTSLEVILDIGKITPDMKLLVTGASGAVGTSFVQLARDMASTHIVALASARNHDMLRNLGADKVVNYNEVAWEDSLEKVDFVFDTVGGDILAKCWKAVNDNGEIVTVGDPAPSWAFGRGTAPEAASRPGVKYSHFIVSPNSERLGQVSTLVDERRFNPLAVSVFSVDEAPKAWDFARQRNRGRKAVIEFVSEKEA